MQEDNELRVNLKYLVYHTLSWIACIDNYYNIHETLKKRNHKYLVKIYWMPSKLKYKNAKFIHKWYLTKKQ